MPRIHSLAYNVQSPAFRVRRPESSVQGPESNVQSPESRVQRPESSVQSPASNSCVQSPGIPLYLFKLPFSITISFKFGLTKKSLLHSFKSFSNIFNSNRMKKEIISMRRISINALFCYPRMKFLFRTAFN